MSAATLAERKARFVATWKCSICQELPIHPFQPVGGHCLCLDCANKLPGNKRLCPTCKADIPTITKQPQLKDLVDEFAAMLWPDTWSLLRTLSDIDDCPVIFNVAAAFVGAATDDQLASLRILRLTARLETSRKGWTPAGLLSLNPLIEVEAGADDPGVWSGPAVWLESVLASDDKDVSLRTKAQFSQSPACHSVHAAFAPRLIPLCAKAAAISSGNDDLLRAYSAFVEKNIDAYPGGWEAFAVLEGASWIAPPKAVAAAFQATPSARLLGLVADAIGDDVLIPDDTPQTMRVITSHVSTGFQSLRSSGALSPDFAMALLRFIGNVNCVLEAAVALEVLGEAGFLPVVLLGMGVSQPVLADVESSAGPAADEADRLTGKRRRE